MQTTVGEVAGGGLFIIYGDRFQKIDRDNPDCKYLGFSSRDGKPHGFAFRFDGGLVLEFPIQTPCEVEEADAQAEEAGLLAAT